MTQHESQEQRIPKRDDPGKAAGHRPRYASRTVTSVFDQSEHIEALLARSACSGLPRRRYFGGNAEAGQRPGARCSVIPRLARAQSPVHPWAPCSAASPAWRRWRSRRRPAAGRRPNRRRIGRPHRRCAGRAGRVVQRPGNPHRARQGLRGCGALRRRGGGAARSRPRERGARNRDPAPAWGAAGGGLHAGALRNYLDSPTPLPTDDE